MHVRPREPAFWAYLWGTGAVVGTCMLGALPVVHVPRAASVASD